LRIFLLRIYFGCIVFHTLIYGENVRFALVFWEKIKKVFKKAAVKPLFLHLLL
jgi:non-homologous end joining protein Ku